MQSNSPSLSPTISRASILSSVSAVGSTAGASSGYSGKTAVATSNVSQHIGMESGYSTWQHAQHYDIYAATGSTNASSGASTARSSMGTVGSNLATVGSSIATRDSDAPLSLEASIEVYEETAGLAPLAGNAEGTYSDSPYAATSPYTATYHSMRRDDIYEGLDYGCRFERASHDDDEDDSHGSAEVPAAAASRLDRVVDAVRTHSWNNLVSKSSTEILAGGGAGGKATADCDYDMYAETNNAVSVNQEKPALGSCDDSELSEHALLGSGSEYSSYGVSQGTHQGDASLNPSAVRQSLAMSGSFPGDQKEADGFAFAAAPSRDASGYCSPSNQPDKYATVDLTPRHSSPRLLDTSAANTTTSSSRGKEVRLFSMPSTILSVIRVMRQRPKPTKHEAGQKTSAKPQGKGTDAHSKSDLNKHGSAAVECNTVQYDQPRSETAVGQASTNHSTAQMRRQGAISSCGTTSDSCGPSCSERYCDVFERESGAFEATTAPTYYNQIYQAQPRSSVSVQDTMPQFQAPGELPTDLKTSGKSSSEVNNQHLAANKQYSHLDAAGRCEEAKGDYNKSSNVKTSSSLHNTKLSDLIFEQDEHEKLGITPSRDVEQDSMAENLLYQQQGLGSDTGKLPTYVKSSGESSSEVSNQHRAANQQYSHLDVAGSFEQAKGGYNKLSKVTTSSTKLSDSVFEQDEYNKLGTASTRDAEEDSMPENLLNEQQGLEGETGKLPTEVKTSGESSSEVTNQHLAANRQYSHLDAAGRCEQAKGDYNKLSYIKTSSSLHNTKLSDSIFEQYECHRLGTPSSRDTEKDFMEENLLYEQEWFEGNVDNVAHAVSTAFDESIAKKNPVCEHLPNGRQCLDRGTVKYENSVVSETVCSSYPSVPDTTCHHHDHAQSINHTETV